MTEAKILMTWDSENRENDKEVFDCVKSAEKFIAENSLLETMSNVKLYSLAPTTLA